MLRASLQKPLSFASFLSQDSQPAERSRNEAESDAKQLDLSSTPDATACKQAFHSSSP